ncbi:hypothetical protein M406DRAFT_330558 [Cryphonectria parasitica EP155]|uniref:Uncharacterized protein n=1 Tax=Cryphonectria parasitica (strain ATCC 38755 / EP155) TaxID=660469 RepID=A0A9P5CND5_CRYP1|nr:uncharacterized protein M406DRAFT_330558 [Cryphonectria parasitica EP155]KAF3764207.1 hypothetical protein M406DRAFT_330558 [Cryphonectria parasitica EP155]
MSSSNAKRSVSPSSSASASSKRHKSQEPAQPAESQEEPSQGIHNPAAASSNENTQDDPAGSSSHSSAGSTNSNEPGPSGSSKTEHGQAHKKGFKVRTKALLRNCGEADGVLENLSLAPNPTGDFSRDLSQVGHKTRPHLEPQQRKALMDELERNVEQIQDPDSQPKFRDLECAFSAPVGGLYEAADFLGLSSEDLLRGVKIDPSSPLRLRPDQVQNVAFLVKNAEGLLKGAINANDHGTGKTIEALSAIFFLAKREAASGLSAQLSTVQLSN